MCMLWESKILLNYSGRFTYISGHPSAVGRAQDRKSSPKTDVLPLCHATKHRLGTWTSYLPVRIDQWQLRFIPHVGPTVDDQLTQREFSLVVVDLVVRVGVWCRGAGLSSTLDGGSSLFGRPRDVGVERGDCGTRSGRQGRRVGWTNVACNTTGLEHFPLGHIPPGHSPARTISLPPRTFPLAVKFENLKTGTNPYSWP